MRISKAIKLLQAIQEKHGDLIILGGCVSDDSGISKIEVIENGWRDVGSKEFHEKGVFLS